MHMISEELMQELIKMSEKDDNIKLLLAKSKKETKNKKVVSSNLLTLAEKEMRKKVKDYIDTLIVKDEKQLKCDYKLIEFALKLIPECHEKLKGFMSDDRIEEVKVETDFPEDYELFDILRISLIDFLTDSAREYISQYLKK